MKNKFGSAEQLASFKREVDVMSRIRFPNVCLLLGACTDPDYTCIVQEYLPKGDLAAALEHNKLPSNFYSRMRLGSQIARGMLWIHSNQVLHRDLKLENLLLDKHDEVKVCDFGLADVTGGQKLIWDERGRKGSPLYMAPEVLLKKGLNSKVDVYSFGIVLWELLAQQRAFQHHLQHNDIEKFIHAICDEGERPPIPPPKTTELEEWKNNYLVKLLKCCWHQKPSERPTFQEIFDELNGLAIDGHIKDDWGRLFWEINFPNDVVDWEEFEKVLRSSAEVELDDGTVITKGLSIDEERKLEIECLKLLLAHISGVKFDKVKFVKCEDFGKVLSWFGPGKEKNGKNFLDRLVSVCQHSWFYGNPVNPEGIVSGGGGKLFLIRLSNPGFFTIQSDTWKSRMEYVPGKGYRVPPSEDFFPDLNDWVQEELINKKSFSMSFMPSEFQSIFHQPVQSSQYIPFQV
uniref:Protein kinase domain-containing protein n=1 Tax=Arcella intermedia TaxID=1963864 RepID=A0A6B2L3F6_9EUKA